MNIGLTYDLVTDHEFPAGAPPDAAGEFDTEDVIDALDAAIRHDGHSTRRIGNIRHLTAFLAAGERVDLVFNIAEGRSGRAREAQVPALLEAHDIPYTGADPVTLAIALDKGLTKRLWIAAGLPTAPYAVIDDPADLDTAELRPDDGWPVFAKPAFEGSSKGIHGSGAIDDAHELRRVTAKLISAYRQPVIIEPFLPGPEYTVGILGRGRDARAIGTVEIVEPVSDYDTKKHWTDATFRDVHDRELRAELERLAVAAYNAVDTRDFGRVDIRLDRDGNPQLLEINPLPGLRPGRSALPVMAAHAGMSFDALIRAVLAETLRRLQTRRDPGADERATHKEVAK